MALGYENTGTGPKLIQAAGNAMTESIRLTGEQIRKDIIGYNTDKQVAGLLSEAQTIQPDSPDFQNQLVGVLAKYPMAANDPRARLGLNLLGNAWEQKNREKELTDTFGRAVTLQGLKNRQNPLYGGGGGGVQIGGGMGGGGGLRVPAAEPEGFSFGVGERGGGVMGRTAPAGGFSFGAGGPEGSVDFGAGERGGGVMGMGRTNKLGLPELAPQSMDAEPDLMGGLHRRLQGIPNLPAKVGATEMAKLAGKITANELAGEKPVFRTIPGVGVGRYDKDSDSFVVVGKGQKPSRWLNDGANWVNPETQEKIAIQISPDQAADNTRADAAAAERIRQAEIKARGADVKLQLQNVKDKRQRVESDRKEKLKTIESFEKEGKKAPPENYEVLKQLDAQLKIYDDVISDISGEGKKLDREAAAQILKEAGGDKDKAREIAKQRGYSL